MATKFKTEYYWGFQFMKLYKAVWTRIVALQNYHWQFASELHFYLILYSKQTNKKHKD